MTAFFDQPEAVADFEFWSKMPSWTLDEATALSFGKNPDIVSGSSMEQYPQQYSSFARAYMQRRRLLRRLLSRVDGWKTGSGVATMPAAGGEAFMPPGELLSVTERNSIAFPQELIDAVRARGERIDSYDAVCAQLDALLRQQAKQAKPPSTREKSFQIMPLKMAKAKFDYNPKSQRNSTAKIIAS
jgi:hypothetical protein